MVLRHKGLGSLFEARYSRPLVVGGIDFGILDFGMLDFEILDDWILEC